MKQSALFFILANVLVGGVFAVCPPDEALDPCECINEEDQDFIELTCSGRDTTQEDLRKALNALDRQDDVLVVLEDMSLGSIRSDFFKGHRIIKIEMENCEFESLASDGGKFFSGLENVLGELDIHNSITADNNLVSLDLSHLKYLTDLDLTKNELSHLDNQWFANGPNLLRLVLSDNGFEFVGDRIFEKLPRLETLIFEGNRFSAQIGRQMFPNPAKILEEIQLNNNAITHIPEDLFSNMPSLKRLSLSGNGIRRIEERTFQPFWHRLELIDFRRNPLECDEHINWLLKLKKPTYLLGKCQLPPERKDVELDDLVL